ncbi:unnamed protein product [Musa acuminata subsp. malaccensis]|uniref:(wild Malaysian banana) hypothetical protein n=1 Tax=Musa acuminata subsp. malaccensis TaxID=214687 RepID=A0A8D7ABV5_MUSAM|nr:unnamed protein product [Musa acuminata subsp. malaccensis]
MDSPRRVLPPSPSPPPPSSSSRPLDLEVTVVSANHLKNVNWRNGDLKPYVVVYLDPDRRAASKPDDAGSTRPVWNERLALPLPSAETLLFLTLDVFHSKPSETPKPLVGTARSRLKDLLHQDAFAGYATGRGGGAPPSPVRTLELRRPSGRPQGKIRIRLAIRERPCPPPEPRPDYRNFSPPPPPIPPYGHPIPSHPPPSQYPYGRYSDPYSSGYYSPAAAYYSAPPAPAPAPAQPYYDRPSGYGGPSAPTGYSSGFSAYDHRPKGGKIGAATGLAVGAVAGALGGLVLEEELRYEEEKINERAESSFSARDDYYSDHRADY